MAGQEKRFGGAAARVMLGLVTTAVVALSVPFASASPESDAADAIAAAWEAAGGDNSSVGAHQGDVYPVGEGFAEDFADGKMFYTPGTGAHALYGPVLQKYEELGGPVGSDLGFPNVDEGPGRVSPDSRSATFSAGDNPVIFYTPEHGAFVVRGAMNAAWDKLGSSSGVLGVPVADETSTGDVIAQKFTGGEVSWNTTAKKFSTAPPELAGDLQDVQVPTNGPAAIDRAWHAAGGADGALGAKTGDEYEIGSDGVGQDFERGKIFFTPETGANTIEGEVLAKYESLGGPAGSDLGFPTANEADGSLPGSRVSTFSGDDKPVIFFTPEHGAFVVRGAMAAAWDKLGGAGGALGAPVGDQSADGNVISQKFTGGAISWDRLANRFSADPARLASDLAGLQVPGQSSPSTSASGHKASGGFTWHWWWLAAALGVLAVAAGLGEWWRRRRRNAERFLLRRSGRRPPLRIGPVSVGARDTDDDWSMEPIDDPATRVRLPQTSSRSDLEDDWRPGMFSDTRYEDFRDDDAGDDDADDDDFSDNDDFSDDDFADDDDDLGEDPREDPREDLREDFADDEDPDAIDTAPTRIPTAAEVHGGRHAVLGDQDDAVVQPPIRNTAAYPAFHLPLDDPYQAPGGYPVKANTVSGLYYTPDSPLYPDTLAEVWFVSEEVAEFNGFIRAD